jgi:exodeoxyribonuclease VII large subunit
VCSSDLQSAVEAVFAQPLWVRVEIQQLRQSQGHWFLELVEHDEQAHVVASTSGTLWKSHLHIVDQFRQQTGVELAEGIKVLLAVQPKLNARYGLKLDVLGIDSAYTLGDMAARLHRIRETLKAEGVFLLNRRLPLPADFRHVAVISPSNAASLGDFRAEADRLQTRSLPFPLFRGIVPRSIGQCRNPPGADAGASPARRAGAGRHRDHPRRRLGGRSGLAE